MTGRVIEGIRQDLHDTKEELDATVVLGAQERSDASPSEN